jgi:hypothetical protein
VQADLITHADGRRYLRTGECDGCASTKPGQCCTFLQFPLAREFSADELAWAELHPGVTIIGQSARIDIPCGALDHGRCTLFGHPERPKLCERYPEQPDQLLDGCAYELVEVRS